MLSSFSRPGFFILLLLPLLMGKQPSPPANNATVREAVHHLFIQGHPLGEIMRRDEKLPNGHFQHTYVLDMQLQRGAHTLNISSELRSFSGPQLQLLHFELTKKEGELVIKSSGKVEEGTLILETTRGGNTTSQTIPLPKDTMSSLSYDFYVWKNRDHLKNFDAVIFHEDLGTVTEQSSTIEKTAAGYRMVHHALSMETQEQYDPKGQLQSAHTLQMDLWAMVPGQQPPDASQKPLDIMAISSWKAPELPTSLQTVTYEITSPQDPPFSPYADAFQTIKSDKKNKHSKQKNADSKRVLKYVKQLFQCNHNIKSLEVTLKPRPQHFNPKKLAINIDINKLRHDNIEDYFREMDKIDDFCKLWSEHLN